MSKPVRVAHEARAEVQEAADWYKRQRAELRAEFLEAVDEVLERLVRMARHLGPYPGIARSLGVKRVFMERFPYSVYFIELPTHYRVIAFAHARRRPFYWKSRL